MKNGIGKISGFAVGAAGFLFLFKIIILDHTSPSDELAPGMVVILAVISGFVFAFIGSKIQQALTKKTV